MRLGWASFLSGLVAVAALIGSEGEARAYCRTTTCECKHGDKALDPLPNGLPQSTCSLATGDCPRDEHGCRKSGTPVAWSGGCVGFSANLAGTSQLTPDEFSAAFDKAFQAWSLVDCGGGKHPSIQVFTLRPTTCAATEYNPTGPNVNAIYFTDNGWADAKSATDLDAVIARTKVHFLRAGEVVDADIAINSARHDFSVSDNFYDVHYDLVSVLTHEVGHFLGLDHSDVKTAVMYWTYGPGTINRDLQPDDIEAICTVYPPDRVTTCDPTPRGGLEDTCGPKPELKGCAAAPNGDGQANTVLSIGLAIFGISALRMTALHRKKGKSR